MPHLRHSVFREHYRPAFPRVPSWLWRLWTYC